MMTMTIGSLTRTHILLLGNVRFALRCIGSDRWYGVLLSDYIVDYGHARIDEARNIFDRFQAQSHPLIGIAEVYVQVYTYHRTSTKLTEGYC